MDRVNQLLILLVIIFVSSGCIDGGEEETESEGTQAIDVDTLRVVPDEIYSGSTVTAELKFTNIGELPADLQINSDNYDSVEGAPYGDRVLTDRCRDLFSVESFNLRGPDESLVDGNTYRLPRESQISMIWTLRNDETEAVPLTGSSCTFRFNVPFNYTVDAFRQIQFKESREVEGTPELQSKSSRGPMKIDISTVGSTADQPNTFIEGDIPQIRITLRNQGDEGKEYSGFINAEFPEIYLAGEENKISLRGEDCENPDDEITVYSGRSRTLVCDIDYDKEIDGAFREEIRVESDYRYVQNLGSFTVDVKPRAD